MTQDPFYKMSVFYLGAIFIISGIAALSNWGCHDVSKFIRNWNCSKWTFQEKGQIMENYAYEGFVYEFITSAASFCFILAFHDQCKSCSTVKQLRMTTLVFLGLSLIATIRMLQKYLSNKSDFTPVLMHFSGEDLTRDMNCDQVPNQVLTRFNFLMIVVVIQPIQLILIVTAFVHFLVFYLEHRNQTERLPEAGNAAPVSLEDNASLNVQFSPRLNFWPFGAPPPPYQDLELVERTGESDPAPPYTVYLNQEEQTARQEIHIPSIVITTVTEEEENDPSVIPEVSESQDSVLAATEEENTEECTEC